MARIEEGLHGGEAMYLRLAARLRYRRKYAMSTAEPNGLNQRLNQHENVFH